MGITLAVFKIAGNIPVEKDKLHIVSRYLDFDLWQDIKILLGPILILRDDIFCKFFSLFVAVIMKESLFFDDKKLQKDFFENVIFDWTVPAIYVSVKVFFIISENGWCVIVFMFHWC